MIDIFRPYPELKQVIVNLKSGSSFRGFVYRYRSRAGFMVLKNAELLADRDRQVDSKALDGELLVQLVDVDFVQVL